MVYNVDNLRLLPKAIRWGAIIGSNNLEQIDYILGDDMLSMEDKKKFMKTVKEIHYKEDILEDWMIEQHERWKYEDEMETARQDGIEEGIDANNREVIINMLKENIAYEIISKVTGKKIDEIKEIEESIK